MPSCTESRFGGPRERDFETGLDDFNARMLRPDLGRFLTPDPLSALPGYAGAQDLSPYTYVQNNPTGFVDPTGLWSVGISIGPYGASWSGTGFGGLGGSGLQLGSWGSFVPAFSFSASFGAPADATTGAAGGQGTGPAATALDLAYVQMVGAGGPSAVGMASQISAAANPAAIMEFYGLSVAGGVIGGAGAILASGGLASGAVTIWGEASSGIGGNGLAGELQLLRLGGESQKFFRTPFGPRFVDSFANGVAHEAKVGFTTLNRRIAAQISKDVYLRDVSGQATSIAWHFFTSPTTGLGGPSTSLMQALLKAGITVILP